MNDSPTTMRDNILTTPILLGLGLLLLGLAIIVLRLLLQSTPEPVIQTPSAIRPTTAENNEPESVQAEAFVVQLGALSPSDELTAIQADLDATIIHELNGSFATIDAVIMNTQ